LNVDTIMVGQLGNDCRGPYFFEAQCEKVGCDFPKAISKIGHMGCVRLSL